MNADATSQHNALLNRLILLVLSLILVCLVLLVVRAYSKASASAPPTSIAEAPATAELPEPVQVAETPIPAAMPRGVPGRPPRREAPIPTRTLSSAPGYGRQGSAETGADFVPPAAEPP